MQENKKNLENLRRLANVNKVPLKPTAFLNAMRATTIILPDGQQKIDNSRAVTVKTERITAPTLRVVSPQAPSSSIQLQGVEDPGNVDIPRQAQSLPEEVVEEGAEAIEEAVVTIPKPYQCGHCEMSFPTSRGLKAHVRLGHTEVKVEKKVKRARNLVDCDECERQFTPKGLKLHKMTIHDVNPILQKQIRASKWMKVGVCNICHELIMTMTISQEVDALQHLRNHGVCLEADCEVEYVVYGNLRALEEHEENEHRNN